MTPRARAWVLFCLTGVPTPALWRGSGQKTAVRPAPQTRPGPVAVQSTATPSPGWLSDDPEVAQYVAEVVTPRATPSPAPPTPRVRRQPAKTPPRAVPAVPVGRRGTETPAPVAGPAGAPKTPRTRAEKAAAGRAAWPSSWDQLAASWDQARG